MLRKLSFLILLTLSIGIQYSYAQKYTIKGEIKDYPLPVKIKIYNSEYKLLSTKTINKASFTIEGNVKKATDAQIVINKLSIPIILENDNYKLHINRHNPYASGGKLNKLVYGYFETDGYKEAISQNEKEGDPFLGVSLNDKELLERARGKFQKQMARKFNVIHPYHDKLLQSDIPLLAKVFILKNSYDWKSYPVTRRISLLRMYKKKKDDIPELNSLLSRYIKMDKEQRGKAEFQKKNTFIDFTAQDINGKKIQFSSILKKNKYTLLEFWASWCGPCRAQFPHLKKVYQKYHSKGLEICAFSIDDKKSEWIKAVKEENVNWYNLSDLKGRLSPVSKAYYVMGVPWSFLIDSNGKIIATNLRDFNIEDKLKEIFNN